MNNRIKRVKRVAFGFTNFRNYRVRALPYGGKPDWSPLATVSPSRMGTSTIYVEVGPAR